MESVFKSWFDSVGLRERRNPSVSEHKEIVSSVESRFISRYESKE